MMEADDTTTSQSQAWISVFKKFKRWHAVLGLVFVYTVFLVTLAGQMLAPDLYQQSYLLVSSELERRQLLSGQTAPDEISLEAVDPVSVTADIPVIEPAYAQGIIAPSWWQGGAANYQGPKQVSTCKNCLLYPVNKENALAADYAPLVVATGLPGGGMLVPEAKDQLVKLFVAANARGLTPKVNSSYRSYREQIDTYNYWVQGQMARGKTRATAEADANRHSARPGHSEHQLGTTVDVNCLSCSPFDRSSKGNGVLWAFLADNAHLYGFVISYPEGKESLTGYVYEPWHLRYIGVELATGIFEQNYLSPGNNVYLADYLSKLTADK